MEKKWLYGMVWVDADLNTRTGRIDPTDADCKQIDAIINTLSSGAVTVAHLVLDGKPLEAVCRSTGQTMRVVQRHYASFLKALRAHKGW